MKNRVDLQSLGQQWNRVLWAALVQPYPTESAQNPRMRWMNVQITLEYICGGFVIPLANQMV